MILFLLPAAYFYVGSSRSPSNQNAYRVRDETGNAGVLKRYRRKSITLTLPDGKNLNNINWFSVWCDEFAVSPTQQVHIKNRKATLITP